jgi:hypothetical protein
MRAIAAKLGGDPLMAAEAQVMNTVFFSWQADTPTREGQNLFERALKRAATRISGDTTVEEPVRDLAIDRDTKGVAGRHRLSIRSSAKSTTLLSSCLI